MKLPNASLAIKNNFKILEVVALLEDLKERGLVAGQVGTIVEILDDSVFEVEFCDNDGRHMRYWL